MSIVVHWQQSATVSELRWIVDCAADIHWIDDMQSIHVSFVFLSFRWIFLGFLFVQVEQNKSSSNHMIVNKDWSLLEKLVEFECYWTNYQRFVVSKGRADTARNKTMHIFNPVHTPFSFSNFHHNRTTFWPLFGWIGVRHIYVCVLAILSKLCDRLSAKPLAT